MTDYKLLEPTYPAKVDVCNTKKRALNIANSFLNLTDGHYQAFQAHTINQLPYYSFSLCLIKDSHIHPGGGWPLITRKTDGLTGYVTYLEKDWLFPDEEAFNTAIIEAFKPFSPRK